MGKLHLLSGLAREVVGDNSYVSDSSLMNNFHRAHVVIDVIGSESELLIHQQVIIIEGHMPS